MSSRLGRALRRGMFGTVGLLASLWVAGQVQAQTSGLAFDPYRPYDGGFDSVAQPPSAAYNYAAINASRSRVNASGSNESGFFFDDIYGSSLGGQDQSGAHRAPPNAPYWYADRQYDKQLGRLPTANPGDEKYYQDQQRRTQEYFAALREPDPKKRAALLHALELDTLRVARDLRPNPRAPVRGRTGAGAAYPGRSAAAGAARTAPGAGTPRAAVMPATGVATPAARALVVPPAAGVSTPAIRARTASPATGVPTPAGAARARIAPPGAAMPRTNRPETPSEIVERALTTEPPSTPADEPVIPPLVPRRRLPFQPPQPPR
jgi:hypothetical protein